MKKLLNFLILLLITFEVSAQTNPSFTPIHNYQAPDGIAPQKYSGIPHGDTATFAFPDSILISGVKTKTPSFLFQESDSTVYIHWGYWMPIKGSGSSLPFDPDSVTVAQTAFPDSCGYWEFNWKGDTLYTHMVYPCGSGGGSSTVYWDDILNKPLINNSVTNGIIDPLLVTWSGTGLVFDVSAGSFIYNNVVSYVAPDQVTLDAADATYPRIDAFYVDTLGNIGKITGVAEPNPVSPQVVNGQFLLTTVYIAAGATEPAVDAEVIYDENTEWTTSSSGTGVIDFNNTVNPYHLTKAIKVTSNSTSFAMKFQKTSGFDTSGIGDVLKLFLYTATPLTSGYTLQFFSGTNAVSYPLSINAIGFGYNPTTLSTYQNISIPFSAFTFTSPYYNSLKITAIGANANPVYWDYIQVQKGLYQYSPTDYSGKADSTTISNGNEYWWSKGSRHLAGAVGGAADRFGIEDNTGVQNRYMDMGTYNIDVISGTNDYSGNTGEIYVSPLLTQLNNYSDATHYSELNISGSTAVMHSTGDGSNFSSLQTNNGYADISVQDASSTTTLNITPTTATLNLNSAGVKYIPLSVNGNYADSTGNITIPTGGTYTASNGLTMSSNNVKLGGNLDNNTNIFQDGTLNLIANSALTLLTLTDNVDNSYNYVLTVGAENGTGAAIQSNEGLPLLLTTAPSTNTGVVTALKLFNGMPSSAAAVVGTGTKIDMYNSATTGSGSNSAGILANSIISKMIDVGISTYTSEFSITGVNSATTQTLLQISGAGVFTLTQGLTNYASNAAAITGGLTAGQLYRNGDIVQIVH